MAARGGTTESLWMRSAELPRFPRLEGEPRADVCVIGAGIAGLTVALLLAREGRSVVVVDDGPIGGGETARTTAHLASALDDRFVEIERLHGERGARLAYESHAAAIDTIESLARDWAPDAGFRRIDGYLFLGAGETASQLDEEHEAALRAGCRDAERLPRLEVGGRDLGPCIRFPGQAQIHPLRYVAGLARATAACGARLFEQAHAIGVEENRGASIVRIDGERSVAASHVVVAANAPFDGRLAIHTQQAAYRSYVVALAVPHGALPAALYWDTEDPYHYVRLVEGGLHDVVIVGGEDHKTGQEDDPAARFDRLERWARDRFPALGDVRHR